MGKPDYINARKRYAELTPKIFKFGCDSGNVLLDVARQFHFVVKNAIVLEDEGETDYIADYMIYDREIKGQKTIDLFYDEAEDMDDESEEMLEAMMNQHTSLFEVMAIDKDKHCLYLKDLINFEIPHRFQLMDLNFSNSAAIGLLVCLRLVPFRGTHITSGISFVFAPKYKESLLNDISFLSFKKGKKISSGELIVSMFHKSKVFGNEMQTANVF